MPLYDKHASIAELTKPDMFQSISVNGRASTAYQYVRRNTNHNSPVTSTTPPLRPV
jgi:hypothetical protein